MYRNRAKTANTSFRRRQYPPMPTFGRPDLIGLGISFDGANDTEGEVEAESSHESYTSSLLSSRDSVINFGSIIGQQDDSASATQSPTKGGKHVKFEEGLLSPLPTAGLYKANINSRTLHSAANPFTSLPNTALPLKENVQTSRRSGHAGTKKEATTPTNRQEPPMMSGALHSDDEKPTSRRTTTRRHNSTKNKSRSKSTTSKTNLDDSIIFKAIAAVVGPSRPQSPASLREPTPPSPRRGTSAVILDAIARVTGTKYRLWGVKDGGKEKGKREKEKKEKADKRQRELEKWRKKKAERITDWAVGVSEERGGPVCGDGPGEWAPSGHLVYQLLEVGEKGFDWEEWRRRRSEDE